MANRTWSTGDALIISKLHSDMDRAVATALYYYHLAEVFIGIC